VSIEVRTIIENTCLDGLDRISIENDDV